MGKLTTTTGGNNAGDKHDGVSDSSDTEPSIITATGGNNAGHGVSDSSDRVPNRRRTESPIITDTGDAAGDEDDDGDSASVAALAKDVWTFDSDPQVLKDLDKCVYVEDDCQKRWFTELRKAWGDNTPKTPKDASRLVVDMFFKVHHYVNACDLQGFLSHYGLPSYYELDLPRGDETAGSFYSMFRFPAQEDQQYSP